MHIRLKIKLALIVIISFSTLGCGTVFTQVGFHKSPKMDIRASAQCGIPQTRVYSGVIFDTRLILTPFICKLTGESGLAFVGSYPFLLVGSVIDLPLSLIADTAILPYTIYQQIAHRNDIYDDLNCIWGTSSQNIYIGGDNGSLFHFDGQNWKQIETNTDNDLNAIWGSSKNNIFIVGDRNTILHYNGEKWSNLKAHNYNAGFTYKDVFGVSEDKILVLSESGDIFFFNGFDWTQLIKISLKGCNVTLTSIWGTSLNNIFLCGKIHRCENGGKIFHYNGSKQTALSIAPAPAYKLYDIWGISDSLAFSVGDHGTVLKYETNKWNFIRSGDNTLTKIWGTSYSNVYAVGSNGTILHYDGNTWKKMNSGTNMYLKAIWGINENNIFAVGEKGTILRYDGKQWSLIQ